VNRLAKEGRSGGRKESSAVEVRKGFERSSMDSK